MDLLSTGAGPLARLQGPPRQKGRIQKYLVQELQQQLVKKTLALWIVMEIVKRKISNTKNWPFFLDSYFWLSLCSTTFLIYSILCMLCICRQVENLWVLVIFYHMGLGDQTLVVRIWRAVALLKLIILYSDKPWIWQHKFSKDKVRIFFVS